MAGAQHAKVKNSLARRAPARESGGRFALDADKLLIRAVQSRPQKCRKSVVTEAEFVAISMPKSLSRISFAARLQAARTNR